MGWSVSFQRWSWQVSLFSSLQFGFSDRQVGGFGFAFSNFRFCRWSEFQLIVACEYSACFLFKSLWQCSSFLAMSIFGNIRFSKSTRFLRSMFWQICIRLIHPISFFCKVGFSIGKGFWFASVQLVVFFLSVAKVKVRCKIQSRVRCCLFVAIESGILVGCLTKRAADGGESARFSSFFVALGFSRFDGESTLPPTAANANRQTACFFINLFGMICKMGFRCLCSQSGFPCNGFFCGVVFLSAF